MEFSSKRDSVECAAGEEGYITTPAGKFHVQQTTDGIRVRLVESYRRHRVNRSPTRRRSMGSARPILA